MSLTEPDYLNSLRFEPVVTIPIIMDKFGLSFRRSKELYTELKRKNDPFTEFYFVECPNCSSDVIDGRTTAERLPVMDKEVKCTYCNHIFEVSEKNTYYFLRQPINSKKKVS